MLLGRASRKGILGVGHCRGRRYTSVEIYLDGVGAVVADRAGIASRCQAVEDSRSRNGVDLLVSRTPTLKLRVSAPRSL